MSLEALPDRLEGGSRGAAAIGSTGPAAPLEPDLWEDVIRLLFPKGTRKALRKAVRKVIRKYGPEFAAAITTGIVTSLLNAVSHKKKKKKKRK